MDTSEVRKILREMDQREFSGAAAVVDCDMASQPWVRTRPNLFGGRTGTPFPKVPLEGECPHPAVAMARLRVCPCQIDLRTLCSGKARTAFREEHVYAGLAVIGVFLCEPHLEYLREYLFYPMICPGCGVAFAGVDEMILTQVSIDEL